MQKNKENSVMVYSKSWCPFCQEVKSLFAMLKVDAKYAELDQLGTYLPSTQFPRKYLSV